MKLYEIEDAIENVLNEATDFETGEIEKAEALKALRAGKEIVGLRLGVRKTLKIE